MHQEQSENTDFAQLSQIKTSLEVHNLKAQFCKYRRSLPALLYKQRHLLPISVTLSKDFYHHHPLKPSESYQQARDFFSLPIYALKMFSGPLA